ncbi:MAG: hypothetical protein KF871_10795 [Hydrogenophaga sp.]|uniref:hypothetical protein n=1 Tax=Hydrogenophaga sp. TaxID=1904254 RepID=UPI001DF03ABF|nr:hypothetical protein [Hydrogenophaga sp.]MBX3610369.1 hypothetical protein [Hydrogenophaga sp.]
MSDWTFPTNAATPRRDQILAPQADYILANAENHTPDQLEAAIKAQGDLVEFHHLCGRNEPAREAFKVVRQLVLMRTPETIARMDAERGLR